MICYAMDTLSSLKVLLPSLLFLTLMHCSATDTITVTHSIRGSQTITSPGKIFKLGFFTSGSSKNHYVGIWYSNISKQTIVWVANRENPLTDSSGVLTISSDGNLVVLDGKRRVLWSSNVLSTTSNSSSAELSDTGNLVLRESHPNNSSNSTGKILWQSFEHPSDTFLPMMKFGANLRTGEKQVLRSWKGDTNPSLGDFTTEIDPLSIPQIIIWNGSQRYWRSGPWNNRIFIGVPSMYSVYLNGFNLFRDDQEGTVYLTVGYADKSIVPRYVLDSTGNLLEWRWNEEMRTWAQKWLAPKDKCDIYGKCGNFGICNMLTSPICSCLRGFEPKFTDEWSKSNWSGGCVRRTKLQCEKNTTDGEELKMKDGFMKMRTVKVPDFENWLDADGEECEDMCLKNCSCLAYSYEDNIGCMWWSGSLIDMQKFSNSGVDLHVRVAYSELVMGICSSHKSVLPLLFFLSLFSTLHRFCTAIDTITHSRSITGSQTITSSGQIFKLGFFTPGNSKNRYVGIWYNNISVQTIVWVANRENPSIDSSGALMISDNGNLVVIDGERKVLWSTNVSNIISNSSNAELLDTGNLVLKETNQGRILWQSFEHPSETFLPTMKFGSNLRTGEKQVLKSWRGDSDPSVGNFITELDPLSIPQIITWNGSKRYWRSGPWNNRIFIGIPTMYSVYLNGFNIYRDDQAGTVDMTFGYADKSNVRFVLGSSGNLENWRWNEEEKEWQMGWLGPENECEVYGKCGPFGSCDISRSPICSCLRGFEPRSQDEWSRGIWSGGCMRKTKLQCERNGTNAVDKEKTADGFLKIETVKVPDFENWLEAGNTKECEDKCLNNCSCLAYSYEQNIGCMSWSGDLIDIEKFSRAGVTLNIRVANSELDTKKDAKIIIIIAVLVGIFIISVCTYLSWRWIVKKRGRRQKSLEQLLFSVDNPYNPNSNMLGDNPDLKIISFGKLVSATNNFSEASKLGQGGFGPVYKGTMPDGQEIAVKRLSKSSGQGLEEFKNEVVVISKLQHRNLVRLLGCCIAGDEKMLIYEYMPNKSLDTFLFGTDSAKKRLLDWKKRFQIIEGISRGILYLHRDSRLKVIHRDLKASNILLDDELNPKISDFGMARIFGCDELLANTNRVVGTYGYMSPEYAMEGQFSEKSDVFSFGVLLLEIVSGKKNTSFHNHGQVLSLLRFAWQFWNENNAISLTDPSLSVSPLSELEILRCIHVGLLCVQDFASDRPTMSTTLSMLTSEITTLPAPKQPAFTHSQPSSFHLNSTEHRTISINSASITNVEGR